ncbi:MAG: lycopene cyclase family protein [Chitinophagaceae bacterium]|nr:lycopene cyclase family protein [Chitinophagaceae bacterium]
MAGAGCAGLSLSVHLLRSGKFSDKKILIIDRDEKKKNDRTWSFWETRPGPFEEVVSRRWTRTRIHGKNEFLLLQLQPYEYKLIRGIDFYNYCLDYLSRFGNVEFIVSDIERIINENGKAKVFLQHGEAEAEFVFNSLPPEPVSQTNRMHWLLQHFKGWIIETDEPAFTADEATLMDFRVSQHHGTTFVYIKPFSSCRALVEYTLFTDRLLRPEEYDEGLRRYISDILQVKNYRIAETESGVIPMTNFPFPSHQGRILFTGTAGGLTRPSTGYTFRFIQKYASALVQSLIRYGHPYAAKKPLPRRHFFYDSVLLRILRKGTVPGHVIFTRLFQRNEPAAVLRFLDGETSLAQELKIISSLPFFPFLKAAIRQL